MPEWKELVQAVGEFEAMKDWMQFEDVRPVSQVLDKLNPRREAAIFSKTDKEDNKLMTSEFANDMMDFLEKKVGIKGQVINDPSQRWKGKLERIKEEGVIRYVPTINIAYAEISDGFHEYAHIFLASLRKSNPALFNALYNELTSAPEWNDIKSRAVTKVKSMYPELTGNIRLEDYKEEVMATAIGYASEKTIAGKQEEISSNLRRVLERIFKWLNDFFVDIFSYKLATQKINENTSLAQVIDWMTDTRTKFILDNNWNAVYETEIQFENDGGVNVQESVSREQDIETNLTADLEQAIIKDPKLDMETYISNWLDKTFKLPKKAYAPRKIPKSVIVENTAKSLLKKIGSTFEMYGLELKKDPSQNSEIVNKLINVLTPIEFTYKFANYLDKKANTSISLSQPFAVVKTTMIKDKTGVERKQTTINLPITENEAVVVNEFQQYLKDKNPGKKSMLADEIKAEYLAWVDENYGISWAEAKGHDFHGFGRAMIDSKVKDRTYRRITFADDFYSTIGHQLTVSKTKVIGPGIGWYVNSTINGERYDHEFQSDILPEIRKSYESGGYDSFKEEYIELSDTQKKQRINDLARSKIYDFIRKSNDRLFASSAYLMDLIREKKVFNYTVPMDDDLPFSKIENYNIDELRAAQKLLLSELDVRIDYLISNRMGYLESLANMKADVKMLQVLTGRKSELKEEVLKLFSTFRIEEENQEILGTPRSTRQTIDPDELPFSKLEGETYLGLSVKGGKIYKIYATEETYKNLPSFFQEFANQSNIWYNSNSRFKPTKEINAVDIFNRLNIPSYFSGDKLKSYPSLVKLRNVRKDGLDKAFNNYRGTKRTIKAYEFRKIVYQDTANILKIAEYFKGQYERYVAFYEDIFQESMEYAKKKEKQNFDQHPEFKRYRRYNALFDKFFPILIAQSVNSAKMEGRDHYYLPTGKAMELIEGNPIAKNLYLTASETGEVISTAELGQRYVAQNTQESADVIKRYVGDKLYTYTQETTPLDIAVDLADTGFYESKEFNDFARGERAKITLKKGMMPGPFNVALTNFAKKNNIKLTEETPEWSKAPLIKVDISGYTVKPIERFSKLDSGEDVDYKAKKFGDDFGKYNGSFRKNVEGTKVLLGSGIISLLKMPESYQKVEGYTRVSLPKVQAAVKGEIGGAEREIMITNEYAKEEIDRFLTEFDIDFITFHESKDAMWVEIPTMVYEQAKLEKRPSYKPSKREQMAMLDEEANAITQPKDKGGEQLSMFYREINEVPSFTEVSEEALPQTEMMINEADVDNDLATNHIKQIADKLSQMLNVPYTIVDEQTAYDLTKDAINSYRGEPAFFYNGQVHFVKGKMRTNMVFHEFSHPLVKAIRLQNPKLFEKLFNDFLKTPEADEVIKKIKQFYPELQSYTEELKEEILVRGIEKAAMDEQKSVEQSSSFMKFIKDIMVAIKQMFRKMFGQNVSVQTLSPNTTLQDLGKMLVEGGQFELETSGITQNDLVEYYKDHSEYIDALSEIAQRDYKKIQELMDVNAQAILKHLSKLEKSQNLQEIANIFKNDFSQSEFAKMKENIKDYSTILNQKLNNMKKDVRFYSASANALTNTLFKLDFIMDKAYKHLKTLNRNDPGSIHKSFYYKELVTDWREFIRNAQDIITNNRDIVGRDHPVAALVNKIDTILNDCEEEIRKVEFEGMNLILNVQMNEMKENIDRRYKEIQDYLEKIGADEKQKKYWRTQYEKVKLDKDTIRKTLEGTMGDANPFNSFLEGYMYNTDPVIGGFARFVYDNITDVLLRAQSKHDAFLAKINPLLEKWGKYNPKKQGELGELIGFKDKIGLRDTDELGNTTFKDFEVWSMLGNFKDYRRQQSRYRYEIDELKKEEAKTGTAEARTARIKKEQEYRKFKRDYMHQELIPSFYDRLNLLEKDEIGIELDARMSQIFSEIGLLYEPSTMQEDVLGTLDKIGKLWRDYYRLGSLTDIQGNKKTGMDYDVAIRMQEYKAASKGLYDFLPKDRAFEDAYEAYQQKLIDTYAKGFKGEAAFLESLEFENYMSKYIAKNTRKVEKKEFWEKRGELLNKIAEASKRGADPRLLSVIERLQDEMRDMLAGFKDEDNQYIAPEMTPELIAKIKKTEEEIENVRAEISAMKELQGGSRLSKEERDQLQGWIEELENLQVYEPTDYYVDAVNDLIANIDSKLLKDFLGTNAVDAESVVALMNKPVIVKDLMDKSPEFKSWMQKNHFISKKLETVEYTDPETGEVLEKKEKRAYYKRIRVWSVVRPRDEKFLETFTFVLNDGTEHTIFGKPSLRFYNRVVKDQFKTGYDFKTGKVNLIVGVHVTNKGNKDFLPRLEDPADRRFINDRYMQLKNAPKGTDDANLYDVLEAIKEYHLENQKGLEVNKKLYLDFPRYRKGFLETLQTIDIFQKKWAAFGVMFRNIADFFRKAKDDPDSGLNPEDQWNLVKADMFNDQAAQIPMTGLYGLDAELVSTNILDSITKYMLSAEKNKKMVELNPYAQALKSILGSDKYKIKDLGKVNKFNFLHRGVITYLNKRGTNVRKQTVENFIEREFEGIQNKGLLSGNAFAQKLSSMMFKNASFGFFSLNIPSALKNSLGAKFQGLIQAASGEHFNLKSFLKAEAWSTNAMKEVSFNIYNRDQKPLVLRIIDVFDVFEGRTAEKMGEGMSRTYLNDITSLGFLMSFRKWTEMQATLQQYGAMMMDKKIMQNGKEISYLDAWEVRDGRLQLKSGIDPTWGITYDDQGNIIMGQEFKNFRSTVHAVIRDLNGAYDQFNQPEAGRYLLYRYFGFLRKYFTTMLVNRYGFAGSMLDPTPRRNPGFNDVREGFYITTVRWLGRTIRNIHQTMPYALPHEKVALRKMATEVGTLLGMMMLLGPLFGWDPDDEERYEKLREKSGAMPFLGMTDENTAYPFHMSGFLSNHALNLMMQVRAENEQFLPLPGFGLDDFGTYLDIKSIAAGPTLIKYGKILTDIAYLVSEDQRGFYQREVGPYRWQQEESAKIWNHLLGTIGLTGSSLDPSVTIKNFQSIQSRQ